GWVVVLTQRRLSSCRSCSSRQLRLLCSDHVLPEDIFTRLSGGHHYCELATVHHRDAIGQREHFVELGADEQNGLALRARIEQLLVDELYRANIDAAGRLRREQHGEVAAHFPGDHHFLLIAAGKGARCEERVRRPNVEGGDLLHRIFHHTIALDYPVLREILLQT